ncbi:DNA replication and repair protein RecF [Putridiphycobacter roseus]|uniref:DNA replication and repair protein RecF n=1 Tax=Putridiphycobacter roseus TaxID=2219161 RepID=A0A2W1N8Z7_9FLAO|nr:DNA replication/repair protein RecF [Putridiphycobacter roseus]PZE15725.1 DNA replication and repair protein RecF [Putridiphycobacter roseus]
MHLKQLQLINFKNHGECQFDFTPDINVFIGDNGVGKTNILDAINYLSLCRSFLNAVDRQNIKMGESFFMIQGEFIRADKTHNIMCSVQAGQKKKIKKNKKEYEKLSDHIGEFPVVVISPYDSNLISEGSEVRRKYIDSIISQHNKRYLETLIRYNKVLAQRNSLLKRFQEYRIFEQESIEVWDLQLATLGEEIFELRNAFFVDFLPKFQYFFNLLTGGKEAIGIQYNTQMEGHNFLELLEGARQKDARVGYTTVGTHKDDLVFTINGNPIKKFGSQGQQKSFLIGLKLTQFDYISRLTEKKPILLLDDIFDKLDHNRVERLMKMVSQGLFGQVFVTDTDAERIEKVFNNIDITPKIFELK